MALTKTETIGEVRWLPSGTIYAIVNVTTLKDGVAIGASQASAPLVFNPGDDVSAQDARIKALAEVLWTPANLDAANAPVSNVGLVEAHEIRGEITPRGLIQVKHTTTVYEDGAKLTSSGHRHVVTPGDVLTAEHPLIAALAGLVHTKAVVDANKAAIAAAKRV